ncbi:MAG: replicative DNA helicase [Chlamydiae bacterium]|nr:replicative DNA helicase [Chlamydiota bacterium]
MDVLAKEKPSDKKTKEIVKEKKSLRVPPQSKEAEKLVLGMMFSSVNALNAAADSLQPEDFYFKEHQIVFHVLQEAYRNDRPADIHLVSEELKRREKLKEVGGILALSEIAQYAGTSAHIEEYVGIVKDKAVLRRMIQTAGDMEKKAHQEPSDVLSFLDECQAKLYTISQEKSAKDGFLLRDILSGVRATTKLPFLKELQDRQEEYLTKGPNEAHLTGIPTHYVDLDKMINGLCPSQLLILAARPSMGKTALALNIAQNVAFRTKEAVGIFSLEMNAEELLHRLICSESEVESEKIKAGSLTGNEYQRVVAAVNEMQKHTVIIDDQPGLKISDLRTRARRMREIYNIKLLVIDYLQLLSGPKANYNSENRQNEISEISRMLKNLARELNIPVVCLSQLSRKVEERQGHRPMLSDLRESGSIEQDADIVMFLFRREYYNPQDKPGTAELIIAKNRHGKVGDVQLVYKKSLALFQNYVAAINESPLANQYNPSFQMFQPK